MVATNQVPEAINQPIIYDGEAVVVAPPEPDLTNGPAGALWQLFLAFLIWVASWLFLFTVPVVTALPYIVYKIISEPGFRAQTLATNKTVILLSLLGVIPAHALTLFVAWAIVTSWKKRSFWEAIHWSWPASFGIWKRFALTLCLAVLAGALLWLGSYIAKVLGGGETDIELLINSSFAARVTLAFIAAATAPFVEEVIYRGVVYVALERAFGGICAVLVVSVMFAGVHVVQYRNNLGVIAVITLLSISLTLVRAFTGRVLPCFIMHLVFNGIQSISIVLKPSLDSNHHVDEGLALIHTVGHLISYLV
jgi:membrane protease YdiL (CAAX protease family)